MLKGLVSWVARSAFDRTKRAAVDDSVRPVHEQMREEFLDAPPFTLHLPAPEIFSSVWAVFRESVLAGPTPRTLREAVATGISHLNQCPYCVYVHGGLAGQAAHDHLTGHEIRAGATDAIRDRDLREAVVWAKSTTTSPTSSVATMPCEDQDRPYLVGTALVFHHINRVVNVFLRDSPLPIPAFALGRGLIARSTATIFGRSMGIQTVLPGASLPFVPFGELPEDLHAVRGAREVELAWSGYAATCEQAGDVIPEPTRTAVGEAIASWKGAPSATSLPWVEAIVGGLEPKQRAIGRFALGTALASGHVTSQDVEAARRALGTERALISCAAWATARCVRRIASRL